MIGQDRLMSQIDDLIEREKFPRFSIIVGENGMESDDVGRYIACRLDSPCVVLPDVKVDTIRDMIQQAYKSHDKLVYIMPNADNMSISAKNAMLKVIEETPNKVYFAMCLEDLSNTLATIQSRGTVFHMNTPTKDDIANFARSLYKNKKDIDEEVIKIVSNICTTPLDVDTLMKYGVKDFYSYVEKVADNIFTIGGAEVFNLMNKLAYKEDSDGYDCRLFLKCLQRVFMDEICDNFAANKDRCGTNCLCSIVRCIGRYMSDLRVRGVNKQMLIDNMILEMRKIWKSQM
jgi:hypothetical protein